MARAIWKGVIKFGHEQIPVKLYSAVQDQAVHFHLLHDQDHVRLRQRMVNPTTGKSVATDAIRKAVEVEPGRFVEVTADELEAIRPKASREIAVHRFFPLEVLDHQWFERPYLLGPDGDGSAEYFALAQALDSEKSAGLAQWVMRDKTYNGLLYVHEKTLVMQTLRSRDEVIPASSFDPPEGRALHEKEVKMARQLIDALASPFDASAYRDEFRDRVRKLIEMKRGGHKVTTRMPRKSHKSVSLEQALRASLNGLSRK